MLSCVEIDNPERLQCFETSSSMGVTYFLHQISQQVFTTKHVWMLKHNLNDLLPKELNYHLQPIPLLKINEFTSSWNEGLHLFLNEESFDLQFSKAMIVFYSSVLLIKYKCLHSPSYTCKALTAPI